MTRFELITKCPENLVTFMDEICGYTNCPPDPWPCQTDVNDHVRYCGECWRLWLEAEAEGDDNG